MANSISSIKVCPDCASRNIVVNEIKERIICRDCGLIFEPFVKVAKKSKKPKHVRTAVVKKKKAKRKPKKKRSKKKAKKRSKKKPKKKAKKRPKKKAKKKSKKGKRKRKR